MATSGSTDFDLTLRQMIKAAFRIIGVYAAGAGEDPTLQEIEDAKETVNTILKSWVADGLQLWVLKQVDVPIVADKRIYTVGPGQDIAIPRPEKITNIIFQDSSTFQRTLNIMSREEYWSLSNKLTEGVPLSWYYDPLFPNGELYLWPIISTINASDPEKVIVIYQKVFDDLDNDSDTFEFPKYWLNSIKWALAAELAFEYGIPDQRLSMIVGKAQVEKDSALSYNAEVGSLYITPESMWYRGLGY